MVHVLLCHELAQWACWSLLCRSWSTLGGSGDAYFFGKALESPGLSVVAPGGETMNLSSPLGIETYPCRCFFLPWRLGAGGSFITVFSIDFTDEIDVVRVELTERCCRSYIGRERRLS